jgi:Peptidase family M28
MKSRRILPNRQGHAKTTELCPSRRFQAVTTATFKLKTVQHRYRRIPTNRCGQFPNNRRGGSSDRAIVRLPPQKTNRMTSPHTPNQFHVWVRQGAQGWLLSNILVLILLFSAWQPLSAGDEISVSPLTSDETAALNTINERNVLAAVAFLASDEMAGRNTPSRELDIAAAYVAARFRGAGLEGLGPDGSFYQTEHFRMVSPPETGVSVSIDGDPVPGVRALMTPVDACTIDGTPVDASSPAGMKFDGPVLVDNVALPPRAAGSPVQVLAMWSRRVRPLANQGATAVLVHAANDSILAEIAHRISREPVALPSQFAFNIPVLLVDDSVTVDKPVTIVAAAARESQVPVHNVIGVLRGSDPDLADEAILITAHLDHIGTTTRGDDTINNGADDNATGVTGVVTLADAFSALKTPPGRSVIFMTFWGEEKGLLGSKYYAQHPIWPLDNTVANINLEMIGRPEEGAEGKAWGTGWPRSTLGPQMAAGAARTGVTIFDHKSFSEMLYTRSDNYSLVNVGVIAHSFSAGSLHSDYHQPSDEVDKLNIPHMTKVIQGLFAGALPIANGELTPTAN